MCEYAERESTYHIIIPFSYVLYVYMYVCMCEYAERDSQCIPIIQKCNFGLNKRIVAGIESEREEAKFSHQATDLP